MKPSKSFVGRWRITETEVWDREALFATPRLELAAAGAVRAA